MTALEQQLKNPVWYSLNETHKKFAVKYKEVLFYDQEVCTFGAFFDEDRTTAASNQYLKTTDSFFFVSENKITEEELLKWVITTVFLRKVNWFQ